VCQRGKGNIPPIRGGKGPLSACRQAGERAPISLTLTKHSVQSVSERKKGDIPQLKTACTVRGTCEKQLQLMTPLHTYPPQHVISCSASSEVLAEEQTGSGGALIPSDSLPGDFVSEPAEERRPGTGPPQPPKGDPDVAAVARTGDTRQAEGS